MEDYFERLYITSGNDNVYIKNLFALLISGDIVLPSDTIISLFESMFHLETEYVSCPSGDLSRITYNPSTNILVVDLKSARVLSNYVQSFDGDIYFINTADLEVIGEYCLSPFESDSDCPFESVYFLHDCPKLHTIEDYFMSNSNGKRVVFPTVNNIKRIGNSFMMYTKLLVHVDMSAFHQLETVGENFMKNSMVRKLNLKNWDQLRSIDNFFMYGCTLLETIDGLNNLPNLRTIGSFFLTFCYKLKSLDLSNLISLEQIGTHFMYECRSLVQIDISGWLSIERIDHDFLKKCIKLRNIIEDNTVLPDIR